MSPHRIQRKRTRGWRMPEDAVYVGRPTKWGNPWEPHPAHVFAGISFPGLSVQGCVDAYANAIRKNDTGGRFHRECPTSDYIREHLAGKVLVCWCPLDQPCHADVLLRIANGGAA